MSIDYKELRDKFKSPLYIYDFDDIKQRFFAIKEAFKARKSQICYALKANSNLSLLKMLVDLDSGFDCVSINEVKRALKAGAKPYKIIFSGVAKTRAELKEALSLKILYINLESKAEMLCLEEVAKELDTKARISIRVNPNVDAKTHPYISTGLHENKFGVEINEAKQMYIYAKKSEFLEPVGVHFHIGSQLLDTRPIAQASLIVAKLVKELKALDIDLKFFDVGGGLGIDYENDTQVDLYKYAQSILASLQGLDLTILLEPGRFLVARSGTLLCSVLYEKKTKYKRFVIVDAAMNDLLRPSLYNAYHKIILPYNKSSKKSKCDVVGGICESGDFFAKDRELEKTTEGEIMLIKDSGAYGFSMSSNYNSRDRICELALENKKIRLIRRRESFEEQIAFEEEFLKND